MQQAVRFIIMDRTVAFGLLCLSVALVHLSGDAPQAGHARHLQGRRAGLLPGLAEPGERRRSALRAEGSRPWLPGVSLHDDPQSHSVDRRRVAHSVLRQAVHLPALGGTADRHLGRQWHGDVQRPAPGRDDLDGKPITWHATTRTGSPLCSPPASSWPAPSSPMSSGSSPSCSTCSPPWRASISACTSTAPARAARPAGSRGVSSATAAA